MLDISDMLDDPDFQVRIPAERGNEGVDDHGRAYSESVHLEITGCIQPITAKELDRLPEADRDHEMLVIYGRELIRTGAPGIAPDVIFYNERRYEVFGVEAWPGWYRATIRPLPEQGESEIERDRQRQ